MSDQFDTVLSESKEELREGIVASVRSTMSEMVEEAKEAKYGNKEELAEEESEDEEEESEDEDESEEDDDTVEEAASGKLIDTKENGDKKAKVYWSSADQEYTVKLFVGGKHETKADYFTDDKTDATGTANQMIK